MILLYSTIYIAIMLLLDAVHDAYNQKGRGIVTDKEAEWKWHQVDSVLKGFTSMVVFSLLMIIFGKFTQLWWIIVIQYILFAFYFMAFRAVWFNAWLNKLKGVPFFHLGKGGYEYTIPLWVTNKIKGKKILSLLGISAEMFGNRSYWAMCLSVAVITGILLNSLNL